MYLRESFVDKLLQQAELLRTAVTSMLNLHNKRTDEHAQDTTTTVAPPAAGKPRAFCSHSEQLLGDVQQAQCALALLQNTCALWRAHCDVSQSELVEELFTRVVSAVRKLANQLVLLMQVRCCEKASQSAGALYADTVL